jgi:hypothetical protein
MHGSSAFTELFRIIAIFNHEIVVANGAATHSPLEPAWLGVVAYSENIIKSSCLKGIVRDHRSMVV